MLMNMILRTVAFTVYINSSGAWWYKRCHKVCLNGLYFPDGHSDPHANGIVWCCKWKDHADSLLTTIMRVTRD